MIAPTNTMNAMTHVVSEPCILCKCTGCVEVCLVDAFCHGKSMLVIHFEECIDWQLCVPECPVNPIYLGDDHRLPTRRSLDDADARFRARSSHRRYRQVIRSRKARDALRELMADGQYEEALLAEQFLVAGQLFTLATTKLIPLSRLVAEPLAQFGRRRDLLHSLLDRGRSL